MDKETLAEYFNPPKPGSPQFEFYCAADDGNLPEVKKLIAAHPSLKTRKNMTILLINGVGVGSRDIVDYAIGEGGDVNAKIMLGGVTALNMAIKRGNADMFLHLLKAGGDPNETDAEGKTLRDLAVESDISGTKQIVEMLDNKKLLASMPRAKTAPKP